MDFHIVEPTKQHKDEIIHGVQCLLKELSGKNVCDLSCEKIYLELIQNEEVGKIFILENRRHQVEGFLALSFSMALHCFGQYATVEELWVRKRVRNLGLGEKLMKHGVKYCQKKGIKRIDVGLPDLRYQSYEKTLNFYKKMDFCLIGDRMKKII